jgi:nucleolar protein 56
MKCYITCSFAGFISIDENCTLLDYELFPRDKLRERLAKIVAGTLTKEEESILKRMVKKCDSIVIETTIPHSRYKNLKDSIKFKYETPNLAGEFLRSNMEDLLKNVGFLESFDDLASILHDLSIDITNDRLREASKSEDMFLIQAINSIEELDETSGKMVERLREWYAIHFPELDKIKNNERYVEMIADIGGRDSIIDSKVLDSDKEFKVKTAKSVGAPISELDLQMVREFAKSIKSLQKTKKSLTIYVERKMGEIAPNLKVLAGASLGAKLIAHVGSIERLSKMPSGTVQVLGAEKALFRHLKTGERPPKHGLIFQHPEVRGAKWWLRGKIARTLALKISLAVRKDVYSGEYDPKIVENFENRVEEIKKANPFPKRSTKPKKMSDKETRKKKKKEKYKKNIKDYIN